MKYKLLMAFALLGVLFLSGCNHSIDFSEYEKGTSVVVIGNPNEVRIISDCAEKKGELTIKNNFFYKKYECVVDLRNKEKTSEEDFVIEIKNNKVNENWWVINFVLNSSKDNITFTSMKFMPTNQNYNTEIIKVEPTTLKVGDSFKINYTSNFVNSFPEGDMVLYFEVNGKKLNKLVAQP